MEWFKTVGLQAAMETWLVSGQVSGQVSMHSLVRVSERGFPTCGQQDENLWIRQDWTALKACIKIASNGE